MLSRFVSVHIFSSIVRTTPIIFFGPELERNRINWDRSPVRIFLSTVERRLTADRSNQISVRRVIATTSCITHGLKTVSPSKNPCDSDPFFGRKLTIEHQRCQIVRLQETHIIQIFLFALLRASSNLVAFMRTRIGYLFRAGAQTESHKEDICCPFFLPTAKRRLAADRSSQIICTRDRV